MIDTDAYENMTWETPSDELEDAVENLLAEVKRLRKKLAEKEDHLYVAEDVLSRSGFWYDVYYEEISEEEEGKVIE